MAAACSRHAGRRPRSPALLCIAGRTSGISSVPRSARSPCEARAAPITTFSTASSTPRSSAPAIARCRAGRVTIGAAAAFLVAQALVGLAVLLSFNRFSIWLGIASLGVVAIYPLMKRVTSWPQAALGLAFSWGALMGWSATFASLAAAADPALPLGLRMDDRLRHDLRAAGRARRRHRRHPLDRPTVRAIARSSASASSMPRARRWLCGDRTRRRRRDRAHRLARLLRPSRLAGQPDRRRRPRRRRSGSFAPTATRGSSCSRGSRSRGGWDRRFR